MTEQFYGNCPEAVVALLNARRDGREPAPRRRKLALIVEGGGMRGVLSAGSLLAVDLLGYRHCFDEIYATSAGAVNAAFFLSGQGESGITVYFDDINNRHFYNPIRLNKIVDVGYAYDYVVPRVKKLDESAIRRSATDLFFSMTEARTGDNVLLEVKRCRESVHKMLKASSAMPVLYNRTVSLEGREFVDGGISCAIPIRQAVARGCTDVLVLLTKVNYYQLAPPTLLEKILMYAFMGRRFPNLMRTYLNMAEGANENRRIVIGDSKVDGVNIATICPSQSELIVERTTMDRSRLIDGAELMAKKTFNLFAADTAVLAAVFNRYRNH